ncbi:hypothetical protein K435DRAFT_618449, partial [Dendrothele bispora CBS 962.96]
TEEEKACVDQTVRDAESDFANYDPEITQLEKALSTLKHKRKCLQVHVAKHRSLLAPVRRLPLEVLNLIFLIHCSGSYPYNYQAREPIVLSHVSTIWRGVALESPLLW